ncbi:MAG: patatin-like phospholipase family protein [Planctomycetes bacterium]|nr:patatin-like phospholipase family protein [Planctomycetota bacterium]
MPCRPAWLTLVLAAAPALPGAAALPPQDRVETTETTAWPAVGSSAPSQTSPASALPPVRGGSDATARPRVVLVLGGDGAYGLANVGVLEALEELHVPVDAVVGTGTGALVGGLYAAGNTPQGLHAALSSIDWDEALLDRAPREHRTYRRKVDDRDFLFDLSVGFRSGTLALPRSVFAAKRWTLFVESLALPAITSRGFDNLPTPFRAVATDLGTGDAVVLDRGDLGASVRAASALPGLFPPVELEGRLLTDGTLSNALPVDVARAMGAEVVLAIELAPPLASKDAITSYIDVGEQILRLHEAESRRAHASELGPGDVHLVLQLKQRSLLSHAQALDIVTEGKTAVLARKDALAQLALDPAAWRARSSERAARQKPLPVLSAVRVEGSGRVAPEIVAERITSPIGEPIDPARLHRDYARVFGLDLYEEVDFRLEGDEETAELVVDARDKSTGPWSLRLGASSQANLSGGSGITLAGLFVLRPVDRYGAEWRTRAEFGESVLLETEYLQPLAPGSPLFVAPRVGYERRRIGLPLGTDTVAEFDVDGVEVGFDVGALLGDWGEVRAGVFHQNGRAALAVGDPTAFQSASFDQGGLEAAFAYDTFDSTGFPRRGSIGEVKVQATLSDLGGSTNSELMTAKHDTAVSWGANTLVLGGEFDTTLQDESGVENRYSLGGFLRLSGFAPNELSGSHALVARALAYHHFGFREGWRAPVSAYVGGSFELGNVFADRGEIELEGLLYSGSVFLALDSFLGPMFVGMGLAERGETNVFLILGSIF